MWQLIQDDWCPCDKTEIGSQKDSKDTAGGQHLQALARSHSATPYSWALTFRVVSLSPHWLSHSLYGSHRGKLGHFVSTYNLTHYPITMAQYNWLNFSMFFFLAGKKTEF